MAAESSEASRAARALYARQMGALLGQRSERLEAAFAAVPREAFLDDKPWRIVSPGGATVTLPQNDPTLIYQDVLLALQPERGVNNGSPSLHIRMLQALDVKPGQRVVHLGAGAGYYTAILAELVGPQGSVLAVEVDPELAAAAERNLKPWKQVGIACGDALDWPRTPADRIYVNFAVARPASPWLENLQAGRPAAVSAWRPRAGATNRRAPFHPRRRPADRKRRAGLCRHLCDARLFRLGVEPGRRGQSHARDAGPRIRRRRHRVRAQPGPRARRRSRPLLVLAGRLGLVL